MSLSGGVASSREGGCVVTSRPPTERRPLSLVSASLSTYLCSLEEVLVWLLGAEERLAAMEVIGDTTAVLKEQFHELEVRGEGGREEGRERGREGWGGGGREGERENRWFW